MKFFYSSNEILKLRLDKYLIYKYISNKNNYKKGKLIKIIDYIRL